MNRLCVFCGSSPGRDPAYLDAAAELGTFLAKRRIGLVYGGAAIGLMGAVADAARAAGGEIIGVIPRALVELEVAHAGLADLGVVASMHERKALMAELSEGFIALPGGIGTLEELFEVWTWGQLGSHRKPCALLNVAGFMTACSAFSTLWWTRHSSGPFTATCCLWPKARTVCWRSWKAIVRLPKPGGLAATIAEQCLVASQQECILRSHFGSALLLRRHRPDTVAPTL